MYNYSLKLNYIESDSDTLYRKEILNAFNLIEYSDKINDEIMILFKKHKNYFINIINTIKKSNNNKFTLFQNTDEYFFFTILFSWEYFYYTHELLKSIHLKETPLMIKKKENEIIDIINTIKK